MDISIEELYCLSRHYYRLKYLERTKQVGEYGLEPCTTCELLQTCQCQILNTLHHKMGELPLNKL